MNILFRAALLPLLSLLSLCYACSGGVEGEIVSTSTISLQLTDKLTGASTRTVSATSPGVLTARITDVLGTPLAKKTVKFTTAKVDDVQIGVVLPKGGSVLTDSTGKATATLRAGTNAGDGKVSVSYSSQSTSLSFYSDGSDPADSLTLQLYRVDSSAANVSADINLDALPPSQQTAVSSLTPGSKGKLLATLTDAYGAALSQKKIAFACTLADITLGAAEATTGSNGQASVLLVVKDEAVAATGIATATYDTVSASKFISIVAKDPKAVKLSIHLYNTDDKRISRIAAGKKGYLQSVLTDSDGNAKSGEKITFSTTLEDMVLSSDSGITDSAGKAFVNVVVNVDATAAVGFIKATYGSKLANRTIRITK